MGLLSPGSQVLLLPLGMPSTPKRGGGGVPGQGAQWTRDCSSVTLTSDIEGYTHLLFGSALVNEVFTESPTN